MPVQIIETEDVIAVVTESEQGPAGPQWPKGVPWVGVWRGEYSSVTTYAEGDVVTYGGSTYYCILASLNNLPTNATYFSLVASKGEPGDAGETGNGIVSVTLIAGDHSPWTLDTYRILYTDTTFSTFQVYNGADGTGGGVSDGDKGDITVSSVGTVWTIDANAVSNAKLSQVATKTFKGRTSAGTGNVEDLTVAQVKTDLAINNVDNTSDANKPVSTAQATAIGVVQSDVDAHEARTDNPHAVTKSQVGLSNVDNTSDSSKPVSTLQAAADAAVQAYSIQRGNHTGTQSADTLVDWITNKVFLATERTKLSGIETGATNDTTATIKTKLGTASTSTDGYLTQTDWNTFNGKQAALGFTPEDVANKAVNFSTVNDTLYPTVQAVKTYADSLVVGLLDYRGGYDASGNVFPTSGGSGTAGAILKWDMFIISVIGTLGGQAVQVGDSVIASVDTPGQTAGNWNILNSNISYVPEDVANKSIDGTLSANSTTLYPSQSAVKTYADTKVTANGVITGATKTKITYDSKGLVTAGTDATTADIADSLNRRYVTDAQLTVIVNTSGTNTGDQTAFNTGLLTGGVVTINADPTKFDVSAGTGVVYDWSNPSSPAKINVSWSAFTAQTIPDFTKPFTTVEIDKTGALVKVSSFASDGTPTARRDKIVLSLLQHFGGTQIENVLTIVKPANETSEALLDYALNLWPVNNGNGATFNGANLNVNKASGTTTLPFINYFNDPRNPTVRTNASGSAVTFNYNYRNWVGGFVITADTTTINPNLYDTWTGTLQAVPVNKYTIQRIYYFPQSDKYGIVYGQQNYGSLSLAQAAIFSEAPVINPLSESGTFVTALIVKQGTTALNNTSDALFSAITSAQSSSSGTTSLQAAYNNSIANPEIQTDATRGAITLRNGAGADTLWVLEVQNTASTPTFGVTGLGWTGIGTNAPTGSLDIQATVYNPWTVSVSWTAVTGVGTAFTKTFKVGDSITTTTTSGSETREINSITSDTVMTMVSAFAGTSSNTAYTSSNTGSQLVILPNGGIRWLGSAAQDTAAVFDWIYKGNTINSTGTQQFTTLRDRTTINQTATVGGNVNTFAALTIVNATGTGSFGPVRGFSSIPTVAGTNTGGIANLVSFLSSNTISVGATGTITNNIGLQISGINNSTTNTVTNQYGIQIAPTQNGGTLTSYTGIAIAAKPTAATNSTLLLLGTTTIPTGTFGIYNTSTAQNYLAGNLGIGQTTPTAYLHLKAGTATANTAPIKLTAGTNMTTPENGAIEFDGTNVFVTVGGVRKTFTIV